MGRVGPGHVSKLRPELKTQQDSISSLTQGNWSVWIKWCHDPSTRSTLSNAESNLLELISPTGVGFSLDQTIGSKSRPKPPDRSDQLYPCTRSYFVTSRPLSLSLSDDETRKMITKCRRRRIVTAFLFFFFSKRNPFLRGRVSMVSSENLCLEICRWDVNLAL